MGQLDLDVFLNACILKGVKGDLEIEASLLRSKWQKLMIRQVAEWHPFKVMNIDVDMKVVFPLCCFKLFLDIFISL